MEHNPKLIYSPEKVAKYSTTLLDLRLNASDAESIKLDKEIEIFSARLMKEYDVNKYAMWHAFGGSTINPSFEAEILHDDFPGDDSMEKFINGLIQKYR